MPPRRRIANPVRAALLGIPAGAGLMVGDGLWQLPVRAPRRVSKSLELLVMSAPQLPGRRLRTQEPLLLC